MVAFKLPWMLSKPILMSCPTRLLSLDVSFSFAVEFCANCFGCPAFVVFVSNKETNISFGFLDCFGGTGILTYSFLGATDVVGAVSFHGGLTDFSVRANISHPVLVLSGGSDDTGTEVEDLENRLNMANATWQITRYSGASNVLLQNPPPLLCNL